MGLTQSVILGIVQGVTEFLPVSSSAHLILVPYFSGWQGHPLVFDAALHLGTSLAVIFYFRRDWVFMLRSFVSKVVVGDKGSILKDMLFLVVIGTVPAGILGFFFNDFVENIFRDPILISLALLVGSFIMFVADKHFASLKGTVSHVRVYDALFIGLMQSLALIPGISRSGVTISGGFLRGLSRETSTKFSFYLATPIILAAGAFSFVKSIREYNGLVFLDLNFAVGVVVSFFVGLVAIRLLLNYIKERGFMVFILYRLFLVVVLWICYLVH